MTSPVFKRENAVAVLLQPTSEGRLWSEGKVYHQFTGRKNRLIRISQFRSIY